MPSFFDAVAQMLVAEHLIAVVQIEHGVKDGVVFGNVLHRTFRKCVADRASTNSLPLVGAVNVVGHEESAAVEIFAQDLALLLGQAPFAGLDGVDERAS